MNKKLIIIGILILFLSSFINAVVIEDLPNNNNTNNINVQQVAEMRASIESLKQDLASKPSQEIFIEYLNRQSNVQAEILELHKSTMIISQILINLCFLGLGFACYFYFKSRGRT
jgi:hypothetical protein